MANEWDNFKLLVFKPGTMVVSILLLLTFFLLLLLLPAAAPCSLLPDAFHDCIPFPSFCVTLLCWSMPGSSSSYHFKRVVVYRL
jgi:hypothetical protein